MLGRFGAPIIATNKLGGLPELRTCEWYENLI